MKKGKEIEHEPLIVHNFDAIKLSIVFIAKNAAMLGGESQLFTQKKMIEVRRYL